MAEIPGFILPERLETEQGMLLWLCRWHFSVRYPYLCWTGKRSAPKPHFFQEEIYFFLGWYRCQEVVIIYLQRLPRYFLALFYQKTPKKATSPTLILGFILALMQFSLLYSNINLLWTSESLDRYQLIFSFMWYYNVFFYLR